MATKEKQKRTPIKQNEDWKCSECEEATEEIICCDGCHICQDISQGLINVIKKYEKVGIMWHCRDCRSGERRPADITTCIDKIHEKIRKESQLTDLGITKSMEAVEELTRKMEMITGGIEQSKMFDEVQLRVNQQTEAVTETFADMVKKTTEGQERVQQPEEMRKIMKDALTQQEKENTDKERRHQNHIIYGVKETGKGNN